MLNRPANVRRWVVLESAKRRMIYGLLRLKLLPIKRKPLSDNGLFFDFLEDQRGNPDVAEAHVYSGHSHGVITMNVAEADSSFRETIREAMNEPYRTLLGHFRHEIGHYYFEQWMADSSYHVRFRDKFGDDGQDYQLALQHYYANGAASGWQEFYISSYASSHPLEDWAETWAHYMLMVETIETAIAFRLVPVLQTDNDFDLLIKKWMQLVIVLNALNRSTGNADAYPFVISSRVRNKLEFIHSLMGV